MADSKLVRFLRRHRACAPQISRFRHVPVTLRRMRGLAHRAKTDMYGYGSNVYARDFIAWVWLTDELGRSRCDDPDDVYTALQNALRRYR